MMLLLIAEVLWSGDGLQAAASHATPHYGRMTRDQAEPASVGRVIWTGRNELVNTFRIVLNLMRHIAAEPDIAGVLRVHGIARVPILTTAPTPNERRAVG
jgi:hypothetical protein